MLVGIDCWKWIVAVNVVLVFLRHSCSEQSFYSFVCAVCAEARIHVPMEGSGWGACKTWFPASVQNGFTVSLEGPFSPSQSPAG